MQHHWKFQPALWVLVGLILAAAVIVALVYWNRPTTRAYQDAVLVCAEVAQV